MIVTLTANPSTDTTVQLDGALERGAVHRALDVHSQPGGKGVNISRAATAAGVPTLAVLPADPDGEFAAQLRGAGIRHHAVSTGSDVRVNWTITEPGGTTTKLNSAGSALAGTGRTALEQALLAEARTATWVVLAGSLPPGVPPEWYADLVVALRKQGTRVAVDTSDAPLLALVDRLPEAAPDLMKPNAEELASFTGTDADTLEADPEAACRAALALVDRGVATVLATLGGAGAVLANASGAWHAAAPPTVVVSTVGAGDSALCGYLIAHLRGLDAASRLAHAVAYGSAAASLPGSTVPTPDQVAPDGVAVRRLVTQTLSTSPTTHPGGTDD